MKIKIKGSPEDIIKRCKGCSHCIFEDILTPEQRKIKVLDGKNPKKHIHRCVVEQLCGKHYDEVCPMKYAAMKASVDDRTAMQLGVVKNYVWDLGKKYKKKIEYRQALKNWTRIQDSCKRRKESYAKRYEKVWDLGIRRVKENGEIIEKQILTSDSIYEIVVAKSITYDKAIIILKILRSEHKERDAV